jgi:hypothetical protein
MGFLTVTYETELSTLYPFEYLYTDLASFEKEAENFTEHFASENLRVTEEALIVPLSFQNNVPLKAQYWQKSKNNKYYHTDHRMHLFTTMLEAPLLYNVLVTPSGFLEKKVEHFAVAIPFPKPTTPESVEKFMLQSDYPVEASAKSAALYTAGMPFGVNWRVRELVHFAPFDKEESN